MQQNYQEFKRVRDFGDLFTDTFTFISNHWKSFFGGFFKLAWPFILIALIGNTYYQIEVSGGFFDLASIDSQNPFSFFMNFIPSHSSFRYFLFSTHCCELCVCQFIHQSFYG